MARRSGLLDTTIRDFSGGWNVADSDLNLQSKFQPISENIRRGIDASISPRWGTRFIKDYRDGTEGSASPEVMDAHATEGAPYIEFDWVGHPLSSGMHIDIENAPDIGGIPADEIKGMHGVLVINQDKFRIATRIAATSTETVNTSFTFRYDTHTLNGTILHGMEFNGREVVFTDIGEVGTRDENNNVTRIWDYEKADALASGLIPTRRCEHWSASTFKSTLIACNGHDRDKPIQINEEFKVEFLVDKASQSNAAVPRADYVYTMQGFVIFVRTEFGDAFLEFSAQGTDGTFTREPDPADAVEFDCSTSTDTTKPVLRGASRIRDKMFVAFHDRAMIGTLGTYNDAGNHVPDFDDTISEHGTVSHRTMVSLGNDILMADYAGVPSVSISQQSGIFVPTRLSELIHPAIQKHLGELDEETLRTRAFAVYDRSDKTYMLFVPKYSGETYNLPHDAIVISEELRALNYALVYFPNHPLFDRSYVTIAGATDINNIAAGDINGVRRVVSIVNDNLFVVELGNISVGAPAGDQDPSGGGGNAITITPVDDEMICYTFEYNKEFRIRRWSRWRDWNFNHGWSTQRGKTYFAIGMKIYQMGSKLEPAHADEMDEYDYTWSSSDTYNTGDRVYDPIDDAIYECQQDGVTGYPSFVAQRKALTDAWLQYRGIPINWAMETPWSGMQSDNVNKINLFVNVSSTGSDAFTLSAFTDEIRFDPDTYQLAPVRTLQMMAGNTGGFNIGAPTTWGGGRRTRDQKVWPMKFKGKYIRWRIEGNTVNDVKITAIKMYYRLGEI